MRANFENLGYFETLQDLSTNRTLGTRMVELDPARTLGEAGTREIVLTGDTVLSRGHKTITVRASKEKPVRCSSRIDILCGRALPR